MLPRRGRACHPRGLSLSGVVVHRVFGVAVESGILRVGGRIGVGVGRQIAVGDRAIRTRGGAVAPILAVRVPAAQCGSARTGDVLRPVWGKGRPVRRRAV